MPIWYCNSNDYIIFLLHCMYSVPGGYPQSAILSSWMA